MENGAWVVALLCWAMNDISVDDESTDWIFVYYSLGRPSPSPLSSCCTVKSLYSVVNEMNDEDIER